MLLFFWPKYFYRPHPKDGEGNVFSLSILGGGGGLPVSHNALQHFPECHGAAGGGTLPGPAGGGVPWPGGVSWLGGTLARGGTLPGGVPS